VRHELVIDDPHLGYDVATSENGSSAEYEVSLKPLNDYCHIYDLCG
jgi:metallophosphoesterase superfamily enzyme